MVGSGIILFLQWEALHDWGVAVVLRRSKWERLSGHVWSRIGAGRMGECRKYGLGRALRTLRPKLVVSRTGLILLRSWLRHALAIKAWFLHWPVGPSLVGKFELAARH